MSAYYNEHEPFAAAWLRNLIAAGLIAPGEVDERDIQDVRPGDLAGFTQCHFFAGIGGWSYALRLAGVGDDEPVWTGSCPCQPFSAAGRQEGKADARHLWPVWASLIRECHPPRIFGEQVASSIAHGWLDEAAHDLEAELYAVAAAVLPACSVGAPHRRDRLWFVADAQRERRLSVRRRATIAGSPVSHMGGVQRYGRSSLLEQTQTMVADLDEPGLEGRQGIQGHHGAEFEAIERSLPGQDWWEVEPDVRVLAHGVPGRVGLLRGFGNAIVPPVAAEFIRASYDCEPANGGPSL